LSLASAGELQIRSGEMQISFDFPEVPEFDKKKLRAEMEKVFNRYRTFKSVSSFKRKEATITQAYVERFHGPTNQTTDQTAEVAIKNVDEQEKRRVYCELIETAVAELDDEEQFLIKERYMKNGRVHDLNVYTFKFDPPISWGTYDAIRQTAFQKLALFLDL
jgi:ArpU family phage transcriptional regulator